MRKSLEMRFNSASVASIHMKRSTQITSTLKVKKAIHSYCAMVPFQSSYKMPTGLAAARLQEVGSWHQALAKGDETLVGSKILKHVSFHC